MKQPKREAEDTEEIRRLKQKLSDLETRSSNPATSAFKRAYSPVRTSNVSRQDQSLSPLSQQLKLAHEEEERLKQEMKKAKLQEIQKKNDLMRAKIIALSGAPAPPGRADELCMTPQAKPAAASPGPAETPSPAHNAATPSPQPKAAAPSPLPAAAPSPAPSTVSTPPPPSPPPKSPTAAALAPSGPAQLNRSSPLETSTSEAPQAEEEKKKAAAAALQTVRRLTTNPHKCTFEILEQWRCVGAPATTAIEAPPAKALENGGGAAPDPKAKTAAKGKAKAKAKGPPQMKAGIFELSKCRASDLREALPRFNRSETKKGMEKEVLAKVPIIFGVSTHSVN
ncbi:hypothetical protein AK812_SmicGene46902 [Symbiodinium microadriaticum]|uniref:Uncharacterized protein n=1 Tax=Symbiodinium microadriaticum TaxID=2951 RepID=A0A1Q9BSU3_SYMMI|nr:hypothetical protein AK812_SmicGene46902 [Symbiodinium microadriaticum]CAE6945953.1 unnamed protein product [Symbiodinium sp. KB8]CAE7200048.1 unnamed protein product [Symbiodinium microadriaticum]